MFKKIVFPRLARLCACLGSLLFIASFGLTACITLSHGCEACGPPPGYYPDVTPLVDADGTLYYIAHHTLYAFQDRSGKLRWQYTNPALDHDTPVVSNGVIYMDMNIAGSSNAGVWIYALSGNTGQVLWHTQISSSFPQILPSEPQVIGDIVYAQSSGETYGATLFALRASDGRVLWSESPRSNKGESVALLLATPGIAYLDSYASDAGYVLARRTSDGTLLWQYTFPFCHIGAGPPMNDAIYISGFCAKAEEADAFQADTGQLLWHFSMPDGLITVTPTHTVVYVDNGANPSPGTDRFFALDANTGQLLWKRQIPQDSVGADTRIWAANDAAVYTTINGVWYALGARDGKQLWEISSNNRFGLDASELFSMQSHLLSHNMVYLWIESQYDAFQASTGKLLWHFGLPAGEYMSSIMRSQDVIYLSGRIQNQQAAQANLQKQDIYAIQADTGKVLWHTIQTQPPQVLTQAGVYFSVATGQPYHYTYSVLALQSSSGKQMWVYQV